MFERITIEKWRQFDQIDIKFHRNLTVITGANGSGKTTILNLLSRHFGWNLDFVSLPKQDKKQGVLSYFSDLWAKIVDTQEHPSKPRNNIGNITYSGGQIAQLSVPESVNQVYRIDISNMISMQGLHIPSHHFPMIYQRVERIPIVPRTRGQLINDYFSVQRDRYGGSGGKPPSYNIKEAIISLAVFGYGNPAVIRNNVFVETFEEFQNVLKTLLPPEVGFEKMEIRSPEVVLITRTGDFSLDAVSGGIASLIDMAWQIYMFSKENDNFIVTIDEPENHLHPKMQRTLLPNLIKTFPNIQFVVATHNPFIVGSVLDCNVYVFTFNAENRVISNLLDWQNRAASANEILRDVLGVPVTYPQWVEAQLDSVSQKFSNIELSTTSLEQLRQELKCLGLAHLLPQSLDRILRKEIK